METVLKEIKENRKKYNIKRDFIIYLMQIKRNVNIQKMLSGYIQHGKTSVYIHSRNVAYMSFLIARFFEKKFNVNINYDMLVVGSMFHDFFLYDWHDKNKCPRLHGFKHPAIASKNAKEYYDINDEEKLIIETHMWPLTITKFPRTIEAKIVCLADKCCSISETIHRF